MNKKKIAITLGVVCGILTYAILLQINTVESMTNEVGTVISDNNDLKDQLLKWQENYNKAREKLEEKELELENIRTQAVSNNSEDQNKENELKENNKLLGLTEVKGKGVIITLDDNRNINQDEILGDINNYLVHEEDLLQIVNELYNAGADAISINDKRIVSTTSILCDGNILRVNGEITGVPITIKAIGDWIYYNINRPQGYLDIMRNDGVIVELEQAEEITIPKYTGTYNYKYISQK